MALSRLSINVRHFELTDSKECWIMGKTTDRYCEGASIIADKAFTITCDEMFPIFKLFCDKQTKKTLKIFTKISENPSKSLKIL